MIEGTKVKKETATLNEDINIALKATVIVEIISMRVRISIGRDQSIENRVRDHLRRPHLVPHRLVDVETTTESISVVPALAIVAAGTEMSDIGIHRDQ